jgi:uncharacterized membrane protein YqgA involved in biofilm formation
MLATIINVIAVIVGSSIGLLLKKGISEKVTDAMMKALGLCVLFIGIQGSLIGEKTLVTIISMVLGAFIGESIDIDSKMNNAIEKLEKKFSKNQNNNNLTLSQGIISASVLFCVGSMTIVGCLNAGFNHDYTLLLTKSTLDFCSSIIFASTMGLGVLLSAFVVLIYQGGLTLLAIWIAPFLTTAIINEMTCVGCLIVIGSGLNLLGLTKLKLMNYIPAMFLPIILCLFL